MRIGFDAKRLFCNFTGLGNYSRSLLKNLAEFQPGNELFLYTPEIRESAETSYFRENKAFNTILSKSAFKSYWRSFSIVKQLQNDTISLYHGLSHELPFGLKTTKIKSIVTIHDLIFKHYPSTYSYFDRKIYDLKFRHSCRIADKIIAISESTKQDIVNFYSVDPKKIEVIYQSCNPLFYQLQEKSVNDAICRQYNIPSEYLLYVGSVEARKNLTFLIKAYSEIRESLRVPLLIVGKGGTYSTELDRMIIELGLQNSVIRIKRLSNNTHLQSVYQNAIALIYPSLYEGFGLPVAEALLCKTPVLTSTTSSLPEAGGPNSIYFDPANLEQLKTGIEKVLNDCTLRTTMAEKGYSYAIENFSPEKLSFKLMGCYRNA